MTRIDSLKLLKLSISPLNSGSWCYIRMQFQMMTVIKSCIKLFLSLCDWEAHPPKGKLYAKYTVCVREGKHGHFEEVTGKLPFLSLYHDKFLVQQIDELVCDFFSSCTIWFRKMTPFFVTLYHDKFLVQQMNLFVTSAHVQSDSEKWLPFLFSYIMTNSWCNRWTCQWTWAHVQSDSENWLHHENYFHQTFIELFLIIGCVLLQIIIGSRHWPGAVFTTSSEISLLRS